MKDIKFSTGLINLTLDNLFRGDTIAISINGIPGSPERVWETIVFKAATNKTIENSISVAFYAQATTIVDLITIRRTSSTGTEVASIVLTGDDRVTFTNNGIFTINLLKFTGKDD